MPDPAHTPYAELTPDVVLDAMDAAGFPGDGRLVALGSYENRVYQVMRDDAPPLVAKFYRPARWSDAAIGEEHAFAAELVAREVPVVAPIARDGVTLFGHRGFRYAVYPKAGGRPPELDRDDVLTWLGRFLARIHVIGATAPFRHRPALTVESFGETPRAFILDGDWLPADVRDAWQSVSAAALDGVRRAFARAGDLATLRTHGDVHAGNVLWSIANVGAGPHFVDLDDARMAPAVQDLWMLLSGERVSMSTSSRRSSRATSDSARSTAASSSSSRRCALCACCTTRHGSPGAGTTRRSPPRSRGSARSATGRTASSSCASRSR